MTIRTRLKKLEDRLDVNREKTITLIITPPTPYCNEPALCFPEPVKEWLTCRDAVEEGRRTGRPVMLIPDPLAEFEVRHGLQPGTLTEHPQRQTISFSELVDTAFSQIAQNIERAVSTLVGLLDATDDRLKRLAANDVIGHFFKHRELAEFEERIAAIERRLERK